VKINFYSECLIYCFLCLSGCLEDRS